MKTKWEQSFQERTGTILSTTWEGRSQVERSYEKARKEVIASAQRGEGEEEELGMKPRCSGWSEECVLLVGRRRVEEAFSRARHKKKRNTGKGKGPSAAAVLKGGSSTRREALRKAEGR